MLHAHQSRWLWCCCCIISTSYLHSDWGNGEVESKNYCITQGSIVWVSWNRGLSKEWVLIYIFGRYGRSWISKYLRSRCGKSEEKWNQITLESFPGGSVVKNPSALQETASSHPGSERYPGEGNGNPLQNTCLGNSMDREEPSGIQSVELQKIGHDLMTKQPTAIQPYVLAYADKEELAIECGNPRVSSGPVRATENCQWGSIQEPAASVLVGEPGLPSLSVVRKKRWV